MEVKHIYSAFVKAQSAFAPALKTSTNPHFKSKYADLAACVEAVIDALNSNGIGLVQRTYEDTSGVTVETVFVHESGEQMDGGRLHVPASKQDPQGYGSALSYARRYSLMAACAIAPEDDDGNAASKSKPKAVHKPTDQPLDLTDDRKAELDELALVLIEAHAEGRSLHASEMFYSLPSQDEQLYIWQQLATESKVRSAIKANKKESA